MSHPDARRARWRADLLDYGAAAQASVGLDGLAAAAGRAADEQRTYADLADMLAEAKATGDPDVIADAKRIVHATRAAWRGTARDGAATIDNFTEPSDAELIELGY